MESSRLARRIAAVAGGVAIVAMVGLTASCAKEEQKAPETSTTTTTTTTPTLHLRRRHRRHRRRRASTPPGGTCSRRRFMRLRHRQHLPGFTAITRATRSPASLSRGCLPRRVMT